MLALAGCGSTPPAQERDGRTETIRLDADAGAETHAARWALDDSLSEPVYVQPASPPRVLSGSTTRDPVHSVQRWRSLVEQHFPPEAVDAALRVLACESGGNERAESGYGDAGLMQIRYSAHYDKVASYEALLDAETNIAVAARIYADSGWIPWGCKP